MYNNLKSGQATVAAVTPALHLSTYRRNILAVLNNSLFTDAERLLANHNVHECEDAQRLATWLRNVRREADRRELAQVAASAEVVTPSEQPAPAAPARATAATVLHLLPAHVVAQVKPRPAGAESASRPRVGYTGRAADHLADVHDHHLEQWYIRETGLSFADRLAL
jgi:hypothetical protein